MFFLILFAELLLIWQFGSLVERISDKNFMDRIDYFQKKTGVSDAVAGELYQGLATSFPEMSTMFISVVFFALNPVIGIASNVGSGVFQFMPVIAIPALMARKALSVDKYEVIRTVIFYITTLILLSLFIMDGNLHRAELAGMVAYWAVFMYWSIRHWPKLRSRRGEPEAPIHDHHMEEQKDKNSSLIQRVIKWFPESITKIIPGPESRWGHFAGIPVGFLIALLVVGAAIYILIQIVENVGNDLGIPMAFLGMTVMATITSLPELATNIPLARKGKGDQIIGNAVGSNSIDIAISTCLMTLLAAMITGQASFGIDDTSAILSAIILLAGVSAGFLLLLWLSNWKIGKTQAWILLVAYLGYVVINYFNFS